jgi:hypothetical protein
LPSSHCSFSNINFFDDNKQKDAAREHNKTDVKKSDKVVAGTVQS